MTEVDVLTSVIEPYNGLEEKPNNSGFLDSAKEAELRGMGWKKSQAWCGFLAKTILWHYYSKIVKPDFTGRVLKQIDQWSGSPMTVRRYVKDGTYDYFYIDKNFEPGAYTIFAHYSEGKEKWTGHAGVGIIRDVDAGTFVDFEGNTSKEGSREGTIAQYKDRNYNFSKPSSGNGLRLKGFIHLKDEYRI